MLVRLLTDVKVYFKTIMLILCFNARVFAPNKHFPKNVFDRAFVYRKKIQTRKKLPEKICDFCSYMDTNLRRISNIILKL